MGLLGRLVHTLLTALFRRDVAQESPQSSPLVKTTKGLPEEIPPTEITSYVYFPMHVMQHKDGFWLVYDEDLGIMSIGATPVTAFGEFWKDHATRTGQWFGEK